MLELIFNGLGAVYSHPHSFIFAVWLVSAPLVYAGYIKGFKDQQRAFKNVYGCLYCREYPSIVDFEAIHCTNEECPHSVNYLPSHPDSLAAPKRGALADRVVKVIRFKDRL